MSAIDSYFQLAESQLQAVLTTQREVIDAASRALGAALASDHWLYAFGTGHSHLLAEEIFYRAGGLARGVPMLDAPLMLHERAIEATYMERREGYAAAVLDRYPTAQGDVLVVASNSGRNAVPVEMALEGKKRGLRVIAITNFAHSKAWPSRHSSGLRLFEAAEFAIDNCGIMGDACLPMEGVPSLIGPTSTITGAFIVNALIVGGIEEAVRLGAPPEIYISSNSNGDDHNHRLLYKYKSRIRHL